MMSLNMDMETTMHRGVIVMIEPLGCPMLGTSCNRMRKRKYAFASFVNWKKRFLGRNVNNVYFVVLT